MRLYEPDRQSVAISRLLDAERSGSTSTKTSVSRSQLRQVMKRLRVDEVPHPLPYISVSAR